MIQRTRRRALAAGLAAWLSLPFLSSSHGATVFHDTFESPGATAANDAGDATDIDWQISPAASSPSVLTVSNDSTFGSNALSINTSGSSSSNELLIGNFGSTTYGTPAFSPVTLASDPGAQIRLSLDFRLTNTPTSHSSNRLRLALLHTAATTATNDDDGYGLSLVVNASANSALMEVDEGVNDANATPYDAKSFAVSDQLKRSLVFTLTRGANGSDIEMAAEVFNASGASLISFAATDTTPSVSTFETLQLINRQNSMDYAMDNVQLQVTVPEPGVLGLMGLGALALLRRR